MFDHRHYVPVLKGKPGEFQALASLDPVIAERITPFIEVIPVPYEFFPNGTSVRKSVDDHVGRLATRLRGAWGIDRPMFIDIGTDPGTEVLSNDRTAIGHVLLEAREQGLKLIPVTTPSRSAVYQAELRAASAVDGLGVAFRITPNEIPDVTTANAVLEALLEATGTNRPQVDLILDFRDILPGQAGTLTLAARAVINMIPEVNEWRTLTLAATAFPVNLGAYGADSINTRERTEWLMWSQVLRAPQALARVPTFADYGVQHSDFTEDIDPRFIQMSANIRYTCASTWLLVKGKNVRKNGFKQFNTLCSRLVARPEYCGAQFSWGDKYISEWNLPVRQKKPGSAMTWRGVGTSHHITYVVRQIASVT